MTNNSSKNEESWGRRLCITMVMNFIIPLIQIYGGLVTGSMALISDALHNMGDFTSLVISYMALRMGRRGPTREQTFGYKRIEVFAAVFNVALLYGVALFIAFEGWRRLYHPQPIKGWFVIWVALAGMIANAFSAILLNRGARVNLNMRSAFLHMITDALVSLGVAILGVVWLFRPWYWLDAVVSWVIVAMILYSGWGILKSAFLIFMNATPPGIDLEIIRREVEAVEGIREMHHLHVWQLSSESTALAAHIVVPDQMVSGIEELAAKVRELLYRRFGIDHPILQFETGPSLATSLLCCPDSSIHSERVP